MYVGGPTAFFLLVGSLIWEDMGPASDAWPMLAAAPWRFFAAFAMSFLVNLSCFFAIQYTSSLTFKASARSIQELLQLIDVEELYCSSDRGMSGRFIRGQGLCLFALTTRRLALEIGTPVYLHACWKGSILIALPWAIYLT